MLILPFFGRLLLALPIFSVPLGLKTGGHRPLPLALQAGLYQTKPELRCFPDFTAARKSVRCRGLRGQDCLVRGKLV